MQACVCLYLNFPSSLLITIMSSSAIAAAIRDAGESDQSKISVAVTKVVEWAKSQPAKFVTKQAIKAILVAAAIPAGPAAIAAAVIASLLIDAKPAY